MPDITSFDSLDYALQQVSGKPTVLEALWDGDTQGWYLCLSVYVKRGIWPLQRTERHPLGTVTLGNDLRLFSGQVPPWPEAEFVKTFVEQTHGTYGLTLYLPSEEPDLDCPRWTEREHAITCADCGKLILPSDSPYVPKDICHTCQLRREQKARIQQDEPQHDGVYLYVYKDNVYRSVGYVSDFDNFDVAPYIDSALLPGLSQDTVPIVTLEPEALVEIQARLTESLEEKLAAYEPPENTRRKPRFATIIYAGVPYELDRQRHNQHYDIWKLFHSWEWVQRALADDASYKFFFKRGFTYRDDSMLRFLKYPTPSPKTVEQIIQHYDGSLTEQEIRGTLAKLEALHCLTIAGKDVTITQTGRNII
ncbi:hypothetical protein KLP40_17340 [Hymenobacter sp. NST-14]|uniref:hypothetical protein n=1 Tax=Hymenobacter piscis TaxID=2839984 RepID=UPI001C024BF5|nr:hypothetical protein [Hymenobacter piscis]MBT9394933.1 hypothetical protein [Hymenobacter piscis]